MIKNVNFYGVSLFFGELEISSFIIIAGLIWFLKLINK